MSSEAPLGNMRAFALRKGSPLELDDRGVQHPLTPGGRGHVFTPYDEITHLAVSSRAVWLAARRSLYLLPRNLFAESGAPEDFARALLEVLSRRPGGDAQLAHMAELERISQAAPRPVVTFGLMAVCVVIFALQWLLPQLDLVAGMSGPLVAEGEVWRLFTANLLHSRDLVFHIALNLVALFVLGGFVEHPMGSARTLCIMAASGVGGMWAAGVAGSTPVVGVSGIVFGLVGAVFWLDYRRAEQLPAWWRIPRGTLWLLVAINVGISLLPFVSTAAHVGGFFAGLAVAPLVAGEGSLYSRAGTWVRAMAAGSLVLTAVAFGTAGSELAAAGDYRVRHVARIGAMPEIHPMYLNDLAWFIAIDPEAPAELQEAALALAERAVDETERSEPAILDTLAELHFRLGDAERAIEVIDEALAIEPDRSYYQEQRRRFSGERDPDDRPSDPALPIPPG